MSLIDDYKECPNSANPGILSRLSNYFLSQLMYTSAKGLRHKNNFFIIKENLCMKPQNEPAEAYGD